MADHTTPTDATRAEEAKEAAVASGAGRLASNEEAAAADSNDVDPAVAAAEKAAYERGAHLDGEGKLP